MGRPALYVGESSRSVSERGREHWASYRAMKEDSHMHKHQVMEHGAAPAKFMLRVVGSYQTALARQVSEAVRIRRRGGEGSILNSRAEYNRCHIPRLRVEEEEESKKRQRELRESQDKLSKELEEEQVEWEGRKTKDRDKERHQLLKRIVSSDDKTAGSKKRESHGEQLEQEVSKRREKRRKYALLEEDWGSNTASTLSSKELQCNEGEGAVIPIAPTEGGGGLSWVETTNRLQMPGGAVTQKQITSYFCANNSPGREEPRAVNSVEETRNLHQMEEPDGFGRTESMREEGEVSTEMEAGVMRLQKEEEKEEMNDPEGLGTELCCATATPPVEQAMQHGFPMSGVSATERCGDKGEDNGQYEESVLSIDDCELKNRTTDDDDCGQSMKCEDKKECEFSRGVCKLHKVKGRKYTIDEKKWTKLKHGYGWRTNRKVRYSCTFVDSHQFSSNQPSDIGSCTSLSGRGKMGVASISHNLNTLSDRDSARNESESLPTRESYQDLGLESITGR